MSDYSKRIAAKVAAKQRAGEIEAAKVLYDKELLDDGICRMWSEVQNCVERKCAEISTEPALDVELAVKRKSDWQLGIARGDSLLLVTVHLLGRTLTVSHVDRRFHRKFELKLRGHKCYLSDVDDHCPILSIDEVVEEGLDALLELRSI